MSTPESSAAPGWYPDPYRRLPFRWWDGSRWTGYAGGTSVEWDLAPIEPRRTAPPGLPGLGIAVLGVAVGTGLAVAVVLTLRVLDRPGGFTAALGLSQVALWMGVVAACIVVSRRRGTGSLVRDFAWRFSFRDVGLGFAGSLVARVMAAVVLVPIPAPFFDLRAPDRSVFEDVAQGAAGWLVLIGVVCIGAPLVEELFFRGLLQTRLVGRYGVVPGVVTTTIVFGAVHLVAWEGTITLLYGLSVAGAGLVLGVMRQATGTLGAPTMAHAFFNTQAVVGAALLG